MTAKERKKAVEESLVVGHGIPPKDAKDLVKTWLTVLSEELMNDPESGYQEAADGNLLDDWWEEVLPEIVEEITARAGFASSLPSLGDKGLIVTPEHLRQMRSNKALGFVPIKCEDFLKLTTSENLEAREIIEEAQPLAAYNRYAEEGTNILPPFLKVSMQTGEIDSHEGRHRAAALCKEAPGTEMWVALIVTGKDGKAVYYVEEGPWPPKKTYLGVESIPEKLSGQFRPAVVVIDKSRFWPIQG